MSRGPLAVAFVAPSGTGKTTLVEAVIAVLRSRGWRVGALKHDAHEFTIDHPGKDSHRFTEAGATVCAIASATQVAIVRRTEQAWSLERVLATAFADQDVVLVEGYKTSDLPKIEVHRAATGHDLLTRGDAFDPTLCAVASDVPLEQDLDVPCLDLDRPVDVADFVETLLTERRAAETAPTDNPDT